MGLYYSQQKKRELELAKPSRGVSVEPSDIDVRMQGVDYWKGQENPVEPRQAPTQQPQAQEPDIEVQKQNLKEKGGVLHVDEATGDKKYFTDSQIAPVAGKGWEEMTMLEKIVTESQTGKMGRSYAGLGLSMGATALAAAGGLGRLIENVNTFGQIEKIKEKMDIDRTAPQVLMDWSNAVTKYQQEKFGDFSYAPKDLTLKNLPHLLTKPEFLIKGAFSMVQSGIVASAGGFPALAVMEGGGLLTEKRADAILRGEEATTQKELLYATGMGIFNGWLENMSFKVMTGAGKIPVSDALISKISNRIVRNIASYTSKVGFEMTEEAVQEGLPVIVSEAMFHAKDDMRSMFERVVDSLPSAMKQAEIGAVMAVPGALLMSSFGTMQQDSQQQTETKAKAEVEAKAKSENQSTADKAMMIYTQSNFNKGADGSGAGINMDTAEISDFVFKEKGKIAEDAVKGRVEDIAEKLEFNFDKTTSDNFRGKMEGKIFATTEEADTAFRTMIGEVLPANESKTFFAESEKTFGQLEEQGVKLKQRGEPTSDSDVATLSQAEDATPETLERGEQDPEFDNIVNQITKNGKIALKEATIPLADLNYEGFTEADFGGESKSKNALSKVKAGDIAPLTIDFVDGKLMVKNGNHTLWGLRQEGIENAKVVISETALEESGLKTKMVEAAETKETAKVKEAPKTEGKPDTRLKVEPNATVRVPQESLKHIYKEAQKLGVDKTISKAITKPLSAEEITKLSDAQTAVLTTALTGIVESSPAEFEVANQNIEALGGTTVEVPTAVAPTEPVSAQTAPTEITTDIKKPKIEKPEPLTTRLAKIDNDIAEATAATKDGLIATREAQRMQIAEVLKKDAETFVDVKAGKGKASAFSLSIKKLPNLKYGYAITMNTPTSSQAIGYKSKFATKEKAQKMGVQKAIRMVETARQGGVPAKGLTMIKTAVMEANKSLGESALTTKKVEKVVKETQKKVKIAKKDSNIKIGKKSKIDGYSFTPKKDTTDPRGGIYAVVTSKENIMGEVVRAKNGKLSTLEAKIKKEIEWQEKNKDAKTKGRIKQVLTNRNIRMNGKMTSRKDYVDSLDKIETSTYESDRIQPMSRRAFNRATQAEQDAHDRKVDAGGKKTTYFVNNIDLGKIAYDYANSLTLKGKKLAKIPKTYVEKLKAYIGDVFDVVAPVHDLWVSKGTVAYIKFKRHQTGEIEKLRQNLLVEDVQEAGGDNVLKVTFKGNTKALRGSKLASVGDYSDIESYQKHISKFNHVELPELVSIVKELSGKVPIIKRMKASLHGYFRPAWMQIALNPKLFENMRAVNLTLAHEMGHMTDYLPEQTMGRGNILGRIGSLRGFLRHTFTDPDVESSIARLLEEKKSLQKLRRETENKPANLMALRKIKEINLKVKELQKSAIKLKDVYDELWALSSEWRPIGDNSSPSFLAYRRSSKELYADAISVLFNDPDLLQQKAPTFYKAFFENLDNKPKVKQTFFDTWELINKGEEALLSKRQKTIYDMFQKGEDVFKIKREEQKEVKYSAMFKLKNEMVDRNQMMIDKVNKAKKAGKNVSDETNPIYFLEEYNYLAGVVKNFVETEVQPILTTLEENGITWADFGSVLMLERAKNERGKMANPGGFSPETAQRQIDFIKKGIGAEKFTILESQIQQFRDATDGVIKRADEAGLYKPDLMEQMKANESYATFQVIDFLEDYIPASIKQQVGTFSDIANPATSTVMKMVSIIRATETNMVKTSVVDFLEKDGDAGDIKPARTVYNGKFHEPVDSKEPGEKLFTILKDGEVTGFYVDPYIAGMIDRNSTATNKGFLLPMIKLFQSKITRPLVIQYNLGFQAFNLIRDFSRFWKNIPGMTFVKAYKLYSKSYEASKQRAKGEFNPIVSEMEKKKILGVTYSEMISGQETLDSQIEHIIEKSGVTSMTPKKKNKMLKPAISLLDKIDMLGQTIETLPKVAGYTYLKDSNIFSEKEIRSFVRTSVGSPDFFRKGAGYAWTNEVFLFSNAIKEAIRADAEIMINPKTRNGYWAKTAASVFSPKLLMLAAAVGLFGEPLKEMFKNISEYDKTNYICVPFGIDKNGKTLYLRIPQDETGRFLGGLMWKSVTMGKNETSAMTDLLQLLSYTGGQLPSISPVLETAVAVGQFATGHNPYDAFRGRSVIPDREFTAGGKYALKPMVLWSMQNMGANVLLNFSVTEKAPASETFGEKFLSFPIVSNVVGRFLRISDYGQIEKAREINAKVEKENNKRLIEWENQINDSVEEYKDGTPGVDRRDGIEDKLVTKILGDDPDSRQASYIRSKFKKTIVKGFGDTKTKAVLSAYTNDAKIEILKGYKKEMGLTKFNVFLEELHEEGSISKAVYNQFN